MFFSCCGHLKLELVEFLVGQSLAGPYLLLGLLSLAVEGLPQLGNLFTMRLAQMLMPQPAAVKR